MEKLPLVRNVKQGKMYKRSLQTWIVRSKQVLYECGLSSWVLAQKHDHWFGIKVTICLQDEKNIYI